MSSFDTEYHSSRIEQASALKDVNRQLADASYHTYEAAVKALQHMHLTRRAVEEYIDFYSSLESAGQSSECAPSGLEYPLDLPQIIQDWQDKLALIKRDMKAQSEVIRVLRSNNGRANKDLVDANDVIIEILREAIRKGRESRSTE